MCHFKTSTQGNEHKSFSHYWQLCVWREHHRLDFRARGGRAKTQPGCSHPAGFCSRLIFDLDSWLWFQQQGVVLASMTSASLCTSHCCFFSLFRLSLDLPPLRLLPCLFTVPLHSVLPLFQLQKERESMLQNTWMFCKLGKWVTQILIMVNWG